ncbi:MAG: transglutaminase domain-containing protein [Clostridiaceae bacterium]|nr:transglutaminase domain-containing protein [Clostridiaceae bacterium]
MPIKKFFEYFAKLLLMIAMSFSLVYPFTTTLGFKYTPLEVLVLVSVFLILLSIFLINGMMTKVSVISFISGALIIVVYSVFNKWFDRITEPFVWIYNYIQGKAPFSEYCAIIFTLLFSFIFSLIVYIFTVKKFNFYLLFLTGISIFCIQWMFDYFVENKAYVSFYTFVVSILIYYLLHIYHKKWAQDSNDFVNPSVFIVFTAPIAILVLLITMFIPVNLRPIEWKWLDEKLYSGINFNIRSGKTINTGYFDLATTGFGNDSSRLGSNVVPNKTLVLKVKSPKKLYLKGRSSDQYTGSSWINTDISYYELNNQNNKLNFDNFEFETGSSLLTDHYKRLSKSASAPNLLNSISKYSVEVFYEDINTNSLFAPLKTSELIFSNFDSNDIFVNAEGVLISRKPLSKGFNYSFETYAINYGDKYLVNLLRTSNRNLYEDYLEYSLFEIWNRLSANVIEFADFYNARTNIRQKDIFQLILESPNADVMKEKLSSHLINKIRALNSDDRIINLLENEVYTFINNIDSQHYYVNNQDLFEYILSLSSLKQNATTVYLKYLEVPDTVPQRVRDLAISITKNEDNDYDKVKAIEQYLSKSFKYNLTPGDVPDGVDFVDYFLFERKEGYCTYFATAMAILTRCINIPSKYVEGYLLPSYTRKNMLYEVTNERAHAWVEVYFAGIGWVQFEPTASFSSNLYQTASSNTPLVQTPKPNLSKKPVVSISPSNTSNFPEQNKGIRKPISKELIIAIAAILSVILLIALTVLLNIYKRKRYLSNIKQLSPREGALELFNYYLKFLLIQDADIKAGETPLDHAMRLDNTGRFHPYKMEDITKIFVNARYSRDELTTSDYNRMFDFYNALLKSTKENIGTLRYVLYRYIMFKL